MGLGKVKSKGKVDEFDKMVLRLKNARDKLDMQAQNASKEANEYREKAKAYLADGNKPLAQSYLYREQQSRKYCSTLTTFYSQTVSQLRTIQERKAQLALKDTLQSVNDLLDGLLKYDADDMREVLCKNAEHAEAARDVMEAIKQMTPDAAAEVADMLLDLEKEIAAEDTNAKDKQNATLANTAVETDEPAADTKLVEDVELVV